MLSRIKPTTGLSRALVLLIGTLCACMWAKSISAKTPQAAAPGAVPTLAHTYSSADIPVPAKQTRRATTNAPGAWLSKGPALLFGMVGLGLIVAAISVRMICRSLPPRDASLDSARALRTLERRTPYGTRNNLELKSPLPQNLYPSP